MVEMTDARREFERIVCPACAIEIDIDWWSDWTSKQFESAFPLLASGYRSAGLPNHRFPPELVHRSQRRDVP
jgi:hypothetical protein